MVFSQAGNVSAVAQINLKMHLLKQPKFSKVRFARALRALFGANWNNSANAGVFCWNLNNAASNSNANISGHLTSFKKLFKNFTRKAETSPTWRNRLSERGLVS